MSGHTVWFEFDDEEAELRDITRDTSVSTLRRKLIEGKIFHFPDGVTQTDVQIGRLKNKEFEKFKARDSLKEVGFDPDETLQVRVKKRTGMCLSHSPHMYLLLISCSSHINRDSQCGELNPEPKHKHLAEFREGTEMGI